MPKVEVYTYIIASSIKHTSCADTFQFTLIPHFPAIIISDIPRPHIHETLLFGEVLHVAHVVGAAPLTGVWSNMLRLSCTEYFDLVAPVAFCMVGEVIAGRAANVVFRRNSAVVQIPYNHRVFQGVVIQCAVAGVPFVIQLAVQEIRHLSYEEQWMRLIFEFVAKFGDHFWRNNRPAACQFSIVGGAHWFPVLWRCGMRHVRNWMSVDCLTVAYKLTLQNFTIEG